MKTMRAMLAAAMTVLAALAAPAQTTHREVKVGNFSSLHVLADIKVNYVCNADSAGVAVLNATSQVANQIILDNNGKGRLTVQLVPEAADQKTGWPTLTLYSSGLVSLENAGDSLVTVSRLPNVGKLELTLVDNGSIRASNLDAGELKLRIATGKGSITATGRAADLVVGLVGKGTIDAGDLMAGNVKARLVGTGKLTCRVADGGTLTLKGSGSGRCYYHGKPAEVKVRKLGSLKAVALDE